MANSPEKLFRKMSSQMPPEVVEAHNQAFRAARNSSIIDHALSDEAVGEDFRGALRSTLLTMASKLSVNDRTPLEQYQLAGEMFATDLGNLEAALLEVASVRDALDNIRCELSA